jgi:hypothetical protein
METSRYSKIYFLKGDELKTASISQKYFSQKKFKKFKRKKLKFKSGVF